MICAQLSAPGAISSAVFEPKPNRNSQCELRNVMIATATVLLTQTKRPSQSSIAGLVPPGTTDRQGSSLTAGGPEDVNAPFEDMFRRLSLSGPEAIEASREIWPSRLQGKPHLPSYLKWHKKVRPGGTIHGPDLFDPYRQSVYVKAKTVEDVASTLVLAMDHFHTSRENMAGSCGYFTAPAGVAFHGIDCLKDFFRSSHMYAM
jgi:hypothetical protein